MNANFDTKDLIGIGLSVLFPTLIAVFGPLVGLILIAFIAGFITGAWLMRRHYAIRAWRTP